MKILVDADSCPRTARELVMRAAKRCSLTAVFVANRPVPGLWGDAMMELCPPGEGAADDRIVELARQGDLVITRDIPLAARVVELNVAVMDDRGNVYTGENIRERLSLRNFIVDLAHKGLDGERNPSYGKKEIRMMANSLDRLLAKLNPPRGTWPGSV
ncbi:MAG: DUF188 domain-containing protein [Treponema sp.]|jgi:uncharacterized protein YaiI (UPF0178 family)|nr:DUF188 domain-containing protein [Treponema sp.]